MGHVNCFKPNYTRDATTRALSKLYSDCKCSNSSWKYCANFTPSDCWQLYNQGLIKFEDDLEEYFMRSNIKNGISNPRFVRIMLTQRGKRYYQDMIISRLPSN